MPQNPHYNDLTLKSQASAYKERLNSWAIARLHPNMEQVIVARFRSRSNAEGYLQHLRQQIPNTSFAVIFDRQEDETVN